MKKCPVCNTLMELNKVSQTYICRKCNQYYNTKMEKISSKEALKIKYSVASSKESENTKISIENRPPNIPNCPKCSSKSISFLSPESQLGFLIILGIDDNRTIGKYRCLDCNFIW